MAKNIAKIPLILLIVVSSLFIPSGVSFSKFIIIDHTCTDVTRIPAYWLNQAKLLTIHYAHTSHGSQINSGILNLESIDSIYSVAIRQSTVEGLPPIEDPPALRMYDGNPPETYITPEDYWYGDAGKNRTRAVIDTGHYDFSMWSWCGQVSSATESYIQNYLATLDQFESEYPGVRFIYMTGHLDGTGSGGNLHIRNQQIREYCIANNKVLYDFADIERYDPDGNDFLDLGADDGCNYSGGNWAQEWCTGHPGSDLCTSCSCAHSQALNCNQKARAFWWMMARLAGWNPEGDELAVDFGPGGIYDYDEGTWTWLTGSDPENMVTVGSALYADFGSAGIYKYNGTWTWISSTDPEDMVAVGNDLYVDFGMSGIYKYDGSWTWITDTDPENMVAVGSDLYADLGTSGIYKYDGTWTWLTGSDPENMIAVGNDLYADFGMLGIYKYDGSWTWITDTDPENMVTVGSALYADFGSAGIYKYNGTWIWISSTDPEAMVAVGNDLYADLGMSGIYKYDGSWTWITDTDPEDMIAVGNDLYADFGSAGIYKYDGTWMWITSTDPEDMIAVDLNP